jgi:hypothetical protein
MGVHICDILYVGLCLHTRCYSWYDINLTFYMYDVMSSVYKFVLAMSASLFRVLYHLIIRHLCATFSIINYLINSLLSLYVCVCVRTHRIVLFGNILNF